MLELLLEYVHTVTIQRMEWPALSPDINPIERVGATSASNFTMSRSDNGPWSSGNCYQTGMSQRSRTNIVHHIRSTQRRCQAVITARGGHTPYWGLQGLMSIYIGLSDHDFTLFCDSLKPISCHTAKPKWNLTFLFQSYHSIGDECFINSRNIYDP